MAQYPNYPDNRMIVDGVDLSETYRMILVDGYTLSTPEVKTSTVEIPGSDGVLDLTEALTGDTYYDNRSDSFSFIILGVDEKDIIPLKNDIVSFLHGKKYNYSLSFDPGYTYIGRFSVSDYTWATYNIGIVVSVTLDIDAEPYKYKDDITLYLNCSGGKWVEFRSGDKTVLPIIEVQRSTFVQYDKENLVLPSGSYNIRNFKLKKGINKIFFDTSYTDIGDQTWGGLSSKTWEDIKSYYWSGIKWKTEPFTMKKWSDFQEETWSNMSDSKWGELSNPIDSSNEEYGVYVSYEWGDL